MKDSPARRGFFTPDLDALKVERDENDQRKEPTISEKVALAEAIEARLPKRDGIRHDTAPAKEIFPELKGQNRDIAAAKAGLGSGKTLEAAQKVIERDIPELVEAMDQALAYSPELLQLCCMWCASIGFAGTCFAKTPLMRNTGNETL